jgi:hypothetical protein
MTTSHLHANADQIRQILRDLTQSSPYVRAAAVVRLSGLTIAAIVPRYVEQDRISAMTATMLMLGERLTAAMRSGELGKVYLQGTTGHIVLMAIGGDAALSVTADQDVPLGLVFLEMELAVEKLKPLI